MLIRHASFVHGRTETEILFGMRLKRSPMDRTGAKEANAMQSSLDIKRRVICHSHHRNAMHF
jgi:hypothetical protein